MRQGQSRKPAAAGRPPERGGWRRLLLVPALLAACGLGGCATVGYYWQSATGHLQLMHAARPVQEWLDTPQTPAPLRERLALTQRMRDFAVTELGLPDNASYRRYADLHRRAAVWNVVAAPAYSLKPRQWCFLVLGCVSYRGYFSEADARAEAAALDRAGLEVTVYGVPAYSTLGWMNWAGGDPLLSTFIHYPEGELARLLFHELAHQVVFVPGDTTFNESFATAVERLGGARWLALQAGEAARAEYAAFDGRRRAFRALTRQTREELARVYEENLAIPLADTARAAMKDEAFRRFRTRYAALRAGWGGDTPQRRAYDAWVAHANNASFAAQAAYDDLVPAFEALFAREGGDTVDGWHRFYEAVRALARQPKAEREQALRALAGT